MDTQQRDDVAPLVVVGVLFAWYLFRCLIPALVSGEGVGISVGVAALLGGTVGLAAMPWMRRSKHRVLGPL
ncbi:MAG: hypothetical protein SFX73_16915 [Kofleriaceae bacterium]|nr:hypothetical protein [Kofleriaceae bacterium]